MATGKKYYWIRLKKDFMTSDAVDFLMGQQNGANYVVLYQMLHLLTINTEGRLSRIIGEVIIPYDVEKIQRDLKWFSIDTIRIALDLFLRLGLIYQDVDGVLVMAKHDEMIGCETDYAAQKKLQRQRKAMELPEKSGKKADSDVDSGVDSVHTEFRDQSIEIREESIKERIPLKGDKKESEPPEDEKTRFRRPTMEEVADYCRERGNGIDAERFISHYESVGWRVGKTPMKDWRAAVRTWEAKEKRRTVKTYEHDDIFYRAAKTLSNRASRRLGLSGDGEETMQAWAAEMEACAEEYGLDPDGDMREALFFSQEDDFWQARIVDAKSFHRCFRQILADMRRKQA